ncbi:MAG: acyl-CoA-binding protein [Candidatus Hydrogenedens sp.]|nr:acyl-CoA-binding protein [Candidatus Hydrogenedens sp.]
MSEELTSQFLTAKEEVTQLSAAPDNLVKLQLYALYKQATEGDVQGARPGMMDFVGRAKYDAWKEHEGKTQDEAKQAYIDLVGQLKAADGK